MKYFDKHTNLDFEELLRLKSYNDLSAIEKNELKELFSNAEEYDQMRNLLISIDENDQNDLIEPKASTKDDLLSAFVASGNEKQTAVVPFFNRRGVKQIMAIAATIAIMLVSYLFILNKKSVNEVQEFAKNNPEMKTTTMDSAESDDSFTINEDIRKEEEYEELVVKSEDVLEGTYSKDDDLSETRVDIVTEKSPLSKKLKMTNDSIGMDTYIIPGNEIAGNGSFDKDDKLYVNAYTMDSETSFYITDSISTITSTVTTTSISAGTSRNIESFKMAGREKKVLIGSPMSKNQSLFGILFTCL